MKVLREGNIQEKDRSKIQKWLADDGIFLSHDKDKRFPIGYISRDGESYFILPKVFPETPGFEDARRFYLALKKCMSERQEESNIFIFMKGQKIDGRSNELTRFDAELALLAFQREHSDWIRTAIYKSRLGNRINWRKTICHTRPLILKKSCGTGRNITYIDFYTKKREVEYDDTLLVLYYSILHYLSIKGYKINIDYNFETIPPRRFEDKYLKGKQGMKILKQIRHKYFDNISLELWNLCKDFFECNSRHNATANYQYLLTLQLNTVFEQIVDELLSDEIKNEDIAVSKEGRKLDHIWVYDDPIIDNHKCIYIADSKYYLEKIDETAINKQFVYPRNVVDNIMMSGLNHEYRKYVYDDVSDGYFIVPNCIVRSASLENGCHVEKIQDRVINKNYHYHHKCRLFDRSTLFLVGIDIDLKYLFESYKDKSTERFVKLREEVRQKIKELTKEWVDEHFRIDDHFELAKDKDKVGQYVKWNNKNYCYLPKP